MTSEQLGEIAYNAYCESRGWKSVRGLLVFWNCSIVQYPRKLFRFAAFFRFSLRCGFFIWADNGALSYRGQSVFLRRNFEL